MELARRPIEVQFAAACGARLALRLAFALCERLTRGLWALAAALFALSGSATASAATELAPAVDHAHHAVDAGAMDEHAHHRTANDYSRTEARYPIPNVKLVRDDGQTVNLRAEIDDGRPVVVAFIYTSCSTVCPLTSHTLSELQARLGSDRDRVHLVSISIDPEQDTPVRLREYAKTYGAGPQWQHYTGTLAASQAVQRAFDVYRGDKMSHSPATLVRAAPGEPWVRLDGFASAEQLYAELPHPIVNAQR